MKTKLNKNLKLLTLPLLLLTTLSAATYVDNYRVADLNQSILKNDNLFMYDDFEKIIRYDMLWFDANKLEENSEQTFKSAVAKIKELKKEKKDFKLTIIAYTNRVSDDENELKIASNTYASKIQNWFRDSLDTNESLELSKKYAHNIQTRLEDENISKELMYLEYRGGNDDLYTNATREGKKLSNGVMLSIYVNQAQALDSDGDGVFDRYDRCPKTPRGFSVDKNGCSIDSDKDKVIDEKDKCPETPIGVNVDIYGCPLDSDGDGVPNYQDKCANTAVGATIDIHGCSIKSTLKLNFASNSAKILKQSYSEVKAFADFLQKNPLYNVEIIGHTDSVGKAALNMKLSQERAATTKKALVKEGVDASRIQTKGRGELDPIASNRLKSGRLINRRIEVKLSTPKN